MSKNLQAKKKKVIHTRSISESVLLLAPLMFIVSILPLIVKAHSYVTTLIKYDWFTELGDSVDIFLYYKQWFFVSTCAIIVCIIVGRAITLKKSLKVSKAFIPLGIYSLLALLSTMFSKNTILGITGVFEQFENIFCILGYGLVVYYCYLVIETEEELQLMINTVATGALLIGLLGTFQAFGLDLFNSEFGKSMIAEKGMSPDSFSVIFEKGRVYASLYNPNYVGVYTSIMIPLFALLLFFAKKKYQFVLYSFVLVTNLISMYGSQSKSGFLSIAVAVLIAIIMLRKKLLNKWIITIPIAAAIVLSFFVINKINNNAYIIAIKNAFHISKAEEPDLQGITTTNDHVEVKYKGNTLFISFSDSNDLIMNDETGNMIPYFTVDANNEINLLQINDDRFHEIIPIIYYNDDATFSLYINQQYWAFSNTVQPGTILFYNRYARYSPIKTADSAVFTGYEFFASRRGYIWSRTIPLLKNYILLGSGADTFVTAFPQYDYVGLYNFKYWNNLISKPHSMYLQIAVQSGVISLIALLVFFTIYLIQCVRLYFSNHFDNVSSVIGLSIFISTISFLISAISNDSSTSVSPVFWVILGLGLTANHLCKKLYK